jgi:ectoine hydroxylase-related dioxygenase (phytanoyl-CoA dioxygenase family)
LFSYALQDQPEGNGGIIFLPGSHKLNYPINTHIRDVLKKHYGTTTPFDQLPMAHCPSFKKGDLLVFTEASVHGTSQWTSTTSWRRHINYKYCYGNMGWLPTETDLNMRLRARATTDLQRAVLDMPYSSRISGNVTEFRKPTLSA